MEEGWALDWEVTGKAEGRVQAVWLDGVAQGQPWVFSL